MAKLSAITCTKIILTMNIDRHWASLVAQKIKNLPAMQETWVQSLGWGDPLGEGNGNPLQYSCLENFMNRGAWLAVVHGVKKELDTS